MIIPFLFDLEDYGLEERPEAPLLQIFYKFFEYSKTYNCPIIASSEYFRDPKKYQKRWGSIFNKDKKMAFQVEIPTFEQLSAKNKYQINEQGLIEYFLNKYLSFNVAWKAILSKRDLQFEVVIEEIILQIVKNFDDTIEALLVWHWMPSLDFLANKYHFKIINLEVSAFRNPNYSLPLYYFCLGSKYNGSLYMKELNEFYISEGLKNSILSRKEILALLLSTDYLFKINDLKKCPSFELGISIAPKNDVFTAIYSDVNIESIIDKAKQLYSSEKICVRTHPLNPVNVTSYEVLQDESVDSWEWISKCKRIASYNSNIDVETMLFGRTNIELSRNFVNAFDRQNIFEFDEEKVESLATLNFIVFCMYVPEKLVFNKEYIKWRLTKPAIEEIFRTHLYSIFETKGVKVNEFFSKKSRKKLKYLIENVHKKSAKSAKSVDVNFIWND